MIEDLFHHQKRPDIILKVAKGEETSNLAWGNQPPASNMRKLVWNDELAVIAQRYIFYSIDFLKSLNLNKLLFKFLYLVQVGRSVYLCP